MRSVSRIHLTHRRGSTSTTTTISTCNAPQFGVTMDGQCDGSSKVLLAYKNASQHLRSSGLKAGLGLLKVATSQWKQDKTACAPSAVGTLPSSHAHPCKRSPLDQLAALVLHGQTRQRHIGQECQREQSSSTKPQNCRRIVVLGAPRVGKTSILRRYLRDGFVEEYSPTSEDFLRKLFRIRGESYQIDILDASRERDFPAKRRLSILTGGYRPSPSYCQGVRGRGSTVMVHVTNCGFAFSISGDIFLLVFSLDDRSSFEEVCVLRTEILAAKSKLTKSSAPEQCVQLRVPLLVCANKVDLPESERAISKTEALRALGEDCAYFETSAKDSRNLEDVFEALAKRGGLPAETGPSQHRKVSLRSYQAMRTGRTRGKGGHLASTCDDACGALYPLARRPSFSTDLRQVIGPQGAKKAGRDADKCQIQ